MSKKKKPPRRSPQPPSGDPWQDPTAKKWVKHVVNEMVPKLEGSVMTISLIPDDREGDVKFWVELGASIMLDKPIIAVAFSDAPIPEKLKLVAEEIVQLPEGVSPESSKELAAALERLATRLGLGNDEAA